MRSGEGYQNHPGFTQAGPLGSGIRGARGPGKRARPRSGNGTSRDRAPRAWASATKHPRDGRILLPPSVDGRELDVRLQHALRPSRGHGVPLAESCRLAIVDSVDYFADVLVRVSSHPASMVADLLPENWAWLFGRKPAGESGAA